MEKMWDEVIVTTTGHDAIQLADHLGTAPAVAAACQQPRSQLVLGHSKHLGTKPALGWCRPRMVAAVARFMARYVFLTKAAPQALIRDQLVHAWLSFR